MRLKGIGAVVCGLLLLLAAESVSAKVIGQGLFRKRDLAFSMGKAKIVANKIVHKFLKHKPFTEEELPILVALQLLEQKIPGKVTDRQYTDQVLDAFLNFSSGAFIVNQDPTMGSRTEFKLVSYDDAWMTRKRGQLMGASYYVSGSLRETAQMNENGKIIQEYEADLQLRDIETDEMVLKTVVTSHRRSMKPKAD